MTKYKKLINITLLIRLKHANRALLLLSVEKVKCFIKIDKSPRKSRQVTFYETDFLILQTLMSTSDICKIKKLENKMLNVTLQDLKSQAQEIQNTEGISYNQALQHLASTNGFKSYQALLAKLEQDYCYDEDDLMSTFKTNIFKNRQFLKSLFIKLQNLAVKYNGARYEDNEELMEKYEETGNDISSTIASIIFNDTWHKFTDNQYISLEGAAFAAYTSCDFNTFDNDIDAHKADYTLQINLDTFSFDMGWRDFQSEYIDGREFKEWGEWQEVELKIP